MIGKKDWGRLDLNQRIHYRVGVTVRCNWPLCDTPLKLLAVGLEPTTVRLQIECSTIELCQHCLEGIFITINRFYAQGFSEKNITNRTKIINTRKNRQLCSTFFKDYLLFITVSDNSNSILNQNLNTKKIAIIIKAQNLKIFKKTNNNFLNKFVK